MKIKFPDLRKNYHKHDWVLTYLHSEIRLKSNPFLWMRIRSHLISLTPPRDRFPELISRVTVIWRIALPLILIITLSFGAYIGFELANDLQNHKELEKQAQQQTVPPEMEPILDHDLDPLNLNLQE